MNLIFTICSNNYLAQAKVLTDSINEFNPGNQIVIGLVDNILPDIDYSFFSPAKILPVTEIGLNELPELSRRYNIIELNTSVKASYFKYFMKKYPEVQNILYFDPDIKIYATLNDLEKKLAVSDIILTPHIRSAIPRDKSKPQENIFLSYGLYNLGFLAIYTKGVDVSKFIDWWEDRILHLGFNRISDGLFVDQLWINLVPIFFKNVWITTEFGYNMAPWNLHERALVKDSKGSYTLNDGSPLYFYHFSSYDYKRPMELCKPYYTRFNFNNRPDLFEIYKTYFNDIFNNKVTFFEGIPCALLQHPNTHVKVMSFKEKLHFWIRQFVPPVFEKLKIKYFNNKY